MHERTAIRNAVAAALIAGGTDAGARVFKTRQAPVKDLPAISVYTLDEDTDPAFRDSAPRELKRLLNVAIDVWARTPANGAVDDVLDDLALQVETVMDADWYFGGTAGDSVLVRTEVAVSADGSSPLGCVHMVYDFVYRTDRRVTPPGDKFDEVDVKWVDLDGAAPTIHVSNQAEDDVTGVSEE